MSADFDSGQSRRTRRAWGRDATLETTRQELRAAKRLTFTSQLKDLKRCRIYIVTVPRIGHSSMLRLNY